MQNCGFDVLEKMSKSCPPPHLWDAPGSNSKKWIDFLGEALEICPPAAHLCPPYKQKGQQHGNNQHNRTVGCCSDSNNNTAQLEINNYENQTNPKHRRQGIAVPF